MAIRLDHGEDELSEVHDINVTPFIDVMLVLLIIFMVAAPLATVDVPVDLPSSTAQPQPQPNKPVFVTIKPNSSLAQCGSFGWNGFTLSVGDNPVSPALLVNALDAATGNNKEERVLLRADRAIAYGDVMLVLDALREAHYLKIALVGLETRSAQ
jgi:biopolymer transport protein ExbD